MLGGRRRLKVRLVRGMLRILPGRVLWVLDRVDQPMVAFEVLSLPLSLLYLLDDIVEGVNLSDSLLTQLAEVLVAQHAIAVDIDSLEELGYL